jgi:hypothetical protein
VTQGMRTNNAIARLDFYNRRSAAATSTSDWQIDRSRTAPVEPRHRHDIMRYVAADDLAVLSGYSDVEETSYEHQGRGSTL